MSFLNSEICCLNNIYLLSTFIKKNIQQGSLHQLLAEANEKIMNAGFEKIDYISICNATTLQPVEIWDGEEKLVALVAAFLNGVRLIDNTMLN